MNFCLALSVSGVNALQSSLAGWEILEYCATAIVLVGVVGEYVAEFTQYARTKKLEKRLGKLSTLVLIVGLAFESLGLFKTSQLSGQLIASLEKQASVATQKAESARETAKGFEAQIVNANSRAKAAEAQVASANARIADAQRDASEAQTKAAALNKEAEAERLARVKIEERLAARAITDVQAMAIVDEVKPFAGQEFEIFTYGEVKEPQTLANRIFNVLRLAGWKSENMTILVGGFAGVLVYVHPGADERTKRAANSLVDALTKVGIESDLRQNPDSRDPNRLQLNVGTKP